MKKLVLLICLFAATIAQAQTKEETINWLQEKLNGYFNRSTLKNKGKVQITACELKITFDDNMEITMPVKGVTLVTRFDIYGKESDVFAEYDYRAVKWKNPDGKITYVGGFYICDLTENDIKNRLQKAFNHLFTFCPQKKEAF